MSTEITKLKEFMDQDALIAAAEIRQGDVPSYYLKNLGAAGSDYNHYIVTVKNHRAAAAIPEAATMARELSVDPMADLMNQTMAHADAVENQRKSTGGVENDPEYLVSSAELLEKSGEQVLARNIYKTLVRKGLAIAEGLMGIGRTFEAEGNLADAERHFREALAYSSAPEIYQRLVSTLIRLGKDDDAARHLIHATGLPGLTNSQRFEFHKTLGNCYARLGEGDKASNHYSKAYDLDPRSDALQVNVGSLALQKGDVESARAHFAKALELNGRNDKAVSGLGMASLAAGEAQKAHDYFIKGLELDVDNIGAIYNLVKTAYEIRSFEPACRMMERYMQLRPESRSNTNILYSYCGLLYHRGLYNTAMEEAERILTLNPQHSGAKEIKALIRTVNQGRSNHEVQNGNAV